MSLCDEGLGGELFSRQVLKPERKSGRVGLTSKCQICCTANATSHTCRFNSRVSAYIPLGPPPLRTALVLLHSYVTNPSVEVAGEECSGDSQG